MPLYFQEGCLFRDANGDVYDNTQIYIDHDYCEFVNHTDPAVSDVNLQSVWWINTDGTYSFGPLPPTRPVFLQDDWVPPPELSDQSITHPNSGSTSDSGFPGSPQPSASSSTSPTTATPRDSTLSRPPTPTKDVGAGQVVYNPGAKPFLPRDTVQPQGRLQDLVACSEELPPLSREFKNCPFGVIGEKVRPESKLDGFHLIPSDLFD